MRPRCWHSTTSNAGGEQREAHELEAGVARVARDREDRRERGLQAFVLARLRRRAFLQERAIRRELGLQQKRHLQHARALGEALPDAFLFGKRVGRSSGRRHMRRVCLRFVRDRAASRADLVSLLSRLSRNVAFPGWWLATTSRWRTTSPLQRRPTIPAFRSRLRKRSEEGSMHRVCFASILVGDRSGTARPPLPSTCA